MDEFDMDEGRYIALTDDSGEDCHFEILDEFDFGGKRFAVLLPFDEVGEDDEENEVIILQNLDGGYFNVDDEMLVSRVFEEFLRRDNQI
ncbi:MAG: DUF1292 domain-containing protein [Oscillospiraceae bacterium]|nr:DUF1292 domain-containing protein [Oscillospiraceae bacterium]